ncbi:MAG: protein translocase subunit SecD [Desulfovibrionaceae bacterium]
MTITLRTRIIIALVVTLLGLTYMLPSIPAVRDSALGRVLPSDTINLGLDLKGGIHLTLGVDVKTAVENAVARMGEDVRADAREEDIVVLKPEVKDGDSLQLTVMHQDKAEAFQEVMSERWSGVFTPESRKNLSNDRVQMTYSLTSEYRRRLEKLTIDQALQTIRSRIDQFGVAEPDIRRQENNRIQVQLPGLEDPERAIQIIGKTAHLEFKIVDDTVDLEKAKKGILPPGRELSVLRIQNMDGSYREEPIVLHKQAMLTGEYITNARARPDPQTASMYVIMNFDRRGERIFARVTGEHVKDRMAIVLDGKVYSAPVIQEKISGGRASITGRFTDEEAHDLALVLRAGSLPAPITIEEQRAVGPSLGQQSIDAGLFSALLGGALVLLFMLAYYRFAGLVADLVLVLNIMFIMAGLAAFGATLTLPGIAGIILTIGMAVDANVLIFERIREELRRGLTARTAIQEGYSRATLTILDANVTTVIAAVILYQFGTGPVRGFAVTLTLGIVASMFTAIFVSRILFDLYTARRPRAALSI